MTGRAYGVKMSPVFAVARASRTSFSMARWFLSICCGVASFGSFGSDRSIFVRRSKYCLRRSFIVASASASAGVSGPTTRSVAGADDGDSDVAGGVGSLSQPVHALSARTTAATRLTPPIREPENRGETCQPPRRSEVNPAQERDAHDGNCG